MANESVLLVDDCLGQDEYPATLVTVSTMTIDTESSTECDAVGVTRCSRAGNIKVYSSTDNSNWTLRSTLYFQANKTAMATFTAATARYWRVVTDASTRFGAVKVGKTVTLPHAIYAGVTPPDYGQTDSRRPAEYSMGQWMGRHVHGRRTSAQYVTTRATLTYVDSALLTALDAMRMGGGAFFAWRPDDKPQEVMYGFLSSEPIVKLVGRLNHTEINIDLSGISDCSLPEYDGPVVSA